ncbi:MAG: transporter related protein, partial [Bacteroidetes bacterium]|nr:transporter related protein [Bacteroidota bacterium]
EKETVPVTKSFSLEHEIRFDKVSYRYENSQRDVLKEVSLHIPTGKTVALVGKNGSGKTTLVKLLCGFYHPESGAILIDGVDTRLIGQQEICEHVAAVFQDFALYQVSAMQNILLGDVGRNPDADKARKAAAVAGIDETLEKLPNGYQTLLGNLFEGSEELSIGQWQKMAIARAFYRDAPLLLMDEPSSALDAASESQLIVKLKELSRNRTSLIISHRLSTVQWADIIYLLNEGEVAEQGTHAELMELKGKYYTLFTTGREKES